MPAPTFSQLSLHPVLQRTVSSLGWPAPTAVQQAVIPLLLAGRDVKAVAPTGTGKTAAFVLPMLHRLADGPGGGRPRGLVLAPTRELAEQLGEALGLLSAGLGLRHTTIVGGTSEAPQVAALDDGCDIVVATPGRLLDLCRRGHLDLGGVSSLVLDEADRLLDLGFWPDLSEIRGLLPEQRQSTLLSATMPAAVSGLVAAFLRDPAAVTAAEPAPPLSRIVQQVLYVRKADKHRLLAHVLEGRDRVMVFIRTRSGADRAVELLASRGRQALALHGQKSQPARRAALDAFRSGAASVLIATDVAARGLHIDGVRCVISFDLPSEPETYIHRVGRTGRMGQPGEALAMCDPSEHSYIRAIETLCNRPLRPVLDHPFYSHDLLPPVGKPRKPSRRKGRRRR